MKRRTKKSVELSRRELFSESAKFGVGLSTLNPLLYTFLMQERAEAGNLLNQLPVFSIHCSGGAAGSRMGPIPRRASGVDNNTIVNSSLWGRYSIDPGQGSVTDGIFTGFGPAYFYKNPAGAAIPYANHVIGRWLQEINTDPQASTILNNVLSVGIANVTGNDNTPGCPGGIGPFISRLWQLASIKPDAAHILGNVNSTSGNGAGTVVNDPFNIRITAGGTVATQLSVGAFCSPLATAGATTPTFHKLAERIEHYMGVKLAKLGNGDQETRFKAIHSLAASDLRTRVNPATSLTESNLNPASDATIKGIFGIPNGTTDVQFKASNNELDKIRTMILGGFRGAYPFVAINRGGFDYHDQSVTTSDARDNELGMILGWITRLSNHLGVPALIIVQSDGSVSATNKPNNAVSDPATESSWQGDDGSYGCWNMTLVRSGWARPGAPGGKAVTQHLINYIGETSNSSGRIASGTFLGSVGREAAAIMAWNYAKLAGLEAYFPQVMTAAGFPQNVTNQIMQKTCFG